MEHIQCFFLFPLYLHSNFNNRSPHTLLKLTMNITFNFWFFIFLLLFLDSPKTGALSKGVVCIQLTFRRYLILNLVLTDNWFTFDGWFWFSIWCWFLGYILFWFFCLLFVWLRGCLRGMCPYWLSECETTSRAGLRVKETYERANGSEYVSNITPNRK